MVLNLGYLVFNDNEWYKFFIIQVTDGKKLSIYNLPKEVKKSITTLVNELTMLCMEYDYSLEGLINKTLLYLNRSSITHINYLYSNTFILLFRIN